MSSNYWLIEKYLEDPEQTKARAAQALAQSLPQLLALARQLGVKA